MERFMVGTCPEVRPSLAKPLSLIVSWDRPSRLRSSQNPRPGKSSSLSCLCSRQISVDIADFGLYADHPGRLVLAVYNIYIKCYIAIFIHDTRLSIPHHQSSRIMSYLRSVPMSKSPKTRCRDLKTTVRKAVM